MIEPFKLSCPVCGGQNCPSYHGTYCREKVIDEKGTYYKNYRIVRFKCNKKCRKKTSCKTFSLLPCGLIPYKPYSIGFIVKILKKWLFGGKSIKEYLDYLSGSCVCSISGISSVLLYRFRSLILESIEKLFIYSRDKNLLKVMNVEDKKVRVKTFLNYLEGRIDGKTRAPCKYGYEFYESNGGYSRNSPFLFGTPSQFRATY